MTGFDHGRPQPEAAGYRSDATIPVICRALFPRLSGWLIAWVNILFAKPNPWSSVIPLVCWRLVDHASITCRWSTLTARLERSRYAPSRRTCPFVIFSTVVRRSLGRKSRGVEPDCNHGLGLSLASLPGRGRKMNPRCNDWFAVSPRHCKIIGDRTR